MKLATSGVWLHVESFESVTRILSRVKLSNKSFIYTSKKHCILIIQFAMFSKNYVGVSKVFLKFPSDRSISSWIITEKHCYASSEIPSRINFLNFFLRLSYLCRFHNNFKATLLCILNCSIKWYWYSLSKLYSFNKMLFKIFYLLLTMKLSRLLAA